MPPALADISAGRHARRGSDSNPIPIDEDAHGVAVAIRDRWEKRTDSPFASLAVDHVTHVVKVYRVPGDAHFNAAVQSIGTHSVRVVLLDAPRNRTGNEALRDAVMAATDLPIEVWAAGLRGDGGGVDLIAEGEIETAQKTLDSAYGPGTVLVEEGRPMRL